MITEREAQERGLVYTGWSSFNQKELTHLVDDLTLKGYVSDIVKWDRNPCFCVYVEKRWELEQGVKSIHRLMETFPNRRQEAFDRYQKELKSIDDLELTCFTQLGDIRREQMKLGYLLKPVDKN